MNAPAAEFDEEEDVEAPQRDRLDGEEVDREHTVGLLAQKRPPREAGTAAGGRMPAWRRIFRTVVADTFRPSPLISPASRW
jgi:hypothetical protein